MALDIFRMKLPFLATNRMAFPLDLPGLPPDFTGSIAILTADLRAKVAKSGNTGLVSHVISATEGRNANRHRAARMQAITREGKSR